MEFSRKVEGGQQYQFCPTGPPYALNRRKTKSCAYMHTLPLRVNLDLKINTKKKESMIGANLK